jgi:RimJ/RimL family protein N-acetyltransferase
VSALETERLLIRPWVAQDVARIGPIYQNPEAVAFTGGARTDEEVEAFVPRQLQRQQQGERVLQPVVDKTTQDVVGVCGLQRLADGPIIEIGWKLAPDHWGKGYATEAARAVLRRGHDEGLARIVAVINPRNQRSIAVANRLYLRFVNVVRVYQQDLLCYESVR